MWVGVVCGCGCDVGVARPLVAGSSIRRHRRGYARCTLPLTPLRTHATTHAVSWHRVLASGRLRLILAPLAACAAPSQVADDILDVEASSEELGKTAGKDMAVDKTTYPKVRSPAIHTAAPTAAHSAI